MMPKCWCSISQPDSTTIESGRPPGGPILLTKLPLDGIWLDGSLVRSGEGSRERLVAAALSITSEWTIGRQLTFTSIYTHFSPREFLERTGPSEAVDFLELTGRFRF